MINCLINCELEYIRCFSKEIEDNKFIRFSDSTLEEMYANNITVLKDGLSNEEIVRVIDKEIVERKKANKEFLIFELQGRVNREVLKAIKIRPTMVSKLDYMIINTDKYKYMKSNDCCNIKEVISEDEFRDIINVSILDNAPFMGEKFSRDRINRKVIAYREDGNGLSAYLCYNGNIAIGSCEMLINSQVAKIEDFGVLRFYQRKGFGTSMVKHLLMEANKGGIDFAYVITDSSDTAKNMYRKCGFEKIGEKTQVLYSFIDEK